MKIILLISFFITIDSKSTGDSTLADSMKKQKQRMEGWKLSLKDSQGVERNICCCRHQVSLVSFKVNGPNG